MEIGIIASDTEFTYYSKAITFLGHNPIYIEKAQQLGVVSGLIISGDEEELNNSILNQAEFKAGILERALSGMAVFGISGGVKVLASCCVPPMIPIALDLMDITAGAGTEPLDMRETEISIPALGKEPVPVKFRHAPIILECRPNVGILAVCDERIVLARQGDFLACTFYPIMIKDFRVLRYFLAMVQETLA